MGKRKREHAAVKDTVKSESKTSKRLSNGGSVLPASKPMHTPISQSKQSPINGMSKKSRVDSASIIPAAKVSRTDSHMDVKTTSPVIQIITGSYERVLHGITASLDLENEKPTVQFSDSFLFNAHTSAIRCLALSSLPDDPSQGVYLATGGSDERVNIFSLSASPLPDSDTKGRPIPSMPSLGSNKISENPGNRELGTLVQHSSNITALQFPTRSKLISSSEDNTISVSRVRDLSVITSIKAPRPKAVGQASGDSTATGITPAGVNDFAVHPSMKLMVSVGRGERCMRLWNLVTGKKAGVLNFDRELLTAAKEGKFSHGEGRKIRWNNAGTEFAVMFERSVIVFGQDSLVKCIAMPQPLTKVHHIAYLQLEGDAELLVVSTEDGRLLFFDTNNASEKSAKSSDVSNARVKAEMGGRTTGVVGRIKDFTILDLGQPGKSQLCIVTGGSDGSVRVWTVALSTLQKAHNTKDPIGSLIGTYETGSRITCLEAFVMLPAIDIEGGMSESEAFTEDEDGDESD